MVSFRQLYFLFSRKKISTIRSNIIEKFRPFQGDTSRGIKLENVTAALLHIIKRYALKNFYCLTERKLHRTRRTMKFMFIMNAIFEHFVKRFRNPP